MKFSLSKFSYVISILIIIFFFLPKIDTHFFDEKHNLDINNAQGLECLGGNNELFIIDGAFGGILYKFKPFTKIASFKNNDKNTQAAINFMAHPTSLIKIENTGVVVNAQQRVAPKITTYNFEKHLIKKFLNDDVIHKVTNKPEYAGLKIDMVSFDNDKYILLSGKKNNISVIEFINKDYLTSICEIAVPNSQNLFWNNSTNKLTQSRNLIGYKGSKLNKIEFLNPESLKEQICPHFNISRSTIFLTLKELEDYSQCGNYEYYLYNDGTLYERKKEI